jgi:hypothetical protein
MFSSNSIGVAAAAVPASEHVRIQQALQAALRSVRLDDVVEVEGPNKLGGYRLIDGERRVALSRVPAGVGGTGNGAEYWCVSQWDDPLPAGAFPGVLDVPVVAFLHRRERVIGVTPHLKDAVVAAIELIVEGRIDDAWRASCAAEPSERDARERAPRYADAPLRRFSIFGTARAFRARHPLGR